MSGENYVPSGDEWQGLSVAAAGFDPDRLQAAIAFSAGQ